ncbi:MAG: family 43 glycosylhydrolase [Salinivirgaceae bacterium]|nr:family 43 glycosylhydrolase [Salinivirgaceae bacterium]
MKKYLLYFSLFLIFGFSCTQVSKIINPIHPGKFADPTIVMQNDTFYIFATIDPWGADKLAVLVTTDFKNWQQKKINWPTSATCLSPTSGRDKVWAPCVIKAPSGSFFMYVTVHNEVWVGTSQHPLGPWKNARPDNTPIINGNLFPNYHMIDAECFIDTDGIAYLYWGSGLNWENGHCFAAKLNTDMISFDGDVKDITPPNYFEAPYMFKRNNRYYLMYSQGKCIDSSYKVRYSIGNTPFGPFTEGLNSPILSTTNDSTTFGPGHHTVININSRDYIIYHRIADNNQTLLRELCMDSLNFDTQGNIMKVNHEGVELFSK